MIRLFFALLVCISTLLSKEFYLNPYFENQLKNDEKISHILKDYVKFLNKISTLDKKIQIEKVNNYINAIVPKYDAYNYRKEEYWATPFEFLSNAGGDCEDYVIAKKYTLGLMGIPSEDMTFSVVKEKYSGGYHMVLSLHVDKNNSFLILDNLSIKILTWEKRIDLEPIFLFNRYGFYRFDEKRHIKEIEQINIPAYKKMRERDKRTLILTR